MGLGGLLFKEPGLGLLPLILRSPWAWPWEQASGRSALGSRSQQVSAESFQGREVTESSSSGLVGDRRSPCLLAVGPGHQNQAESQGKDDVI